MFQARKRRAADEAAEASALEAALTRATRDDTLPPEIANLVDVAHALAPGNAPRQVFLDALEARMRREFTRPVIEPSEHAGSRDCDSGAVHMHQGEIQDASLGRFLVVDVEPVTDEGLQATVEQLSTLAELARLERDFRP